MHPAVKRAYLQWLDKRNKVFPDFSQFIELRKKARKIREKNSSKISDLFQKFKENAEKNGAKVFPVYEKEELFEHLSDVLKNKNLILKTKTLTSEEINLNRFLENLGKEVIETDLGEFIIQVAGEQPSHPTAPALHKTKEEIAKIISKKLKKKIPPRPEYMVKEIRKFMRRKFFKIEAGITGANFLVAESGHSVLITNEGNGRMILTFAPLHIIIAGVEKLVENLNEALFLSQMLVKSATGQKITSYTSFFKPDNKRIYFILFYGRERILEDENFREAIYCIKCGACMMVCPVYQQIGGIRMGGGAYMGGIGAVWTFFTQSKEKAKFHSLCLSCYRCSDVCPVNISIPEMIASLKKFYKPNTLKKIALTKILKK